MPAAFNLVADARYSPVSRASAGPRHLPAALTWLCISHETPVPSYLKPCPHPVQRSKRPDTSVTRRGARRSIALHGEDPSPERDRPEPR